MHMQLGCASRGGQWLSICYRNIIHESLASKCKLETRAQLKEESVITDSEDFLLLCGKVDPQMLEAEKGAQLMKRVSDYAFQLHFTKEPCSAKTFVLECKKMKVAQRNRLQQLCVRRRPNAVHIRQVL